MKKKVTVTKKNFTSAHSLQKGHDTETNRQTDRLSQYSLILILTDRLCGLVVRVPGYSSRGKDSIPGTTRFSETYIDRSPLWFWSDFLATDPEVGIRFPALLDFLRSSSSGSGLEIREYGRRNPSRSPRCTPYQQFSTNFDDKRRSLGRCSSLTDSGHRVFCCYFSYSFFFLSLDSEDVGSMFYETLLNFFIYYLLFMFCGGSR
jgi:hypothetical protein